MTTPALRTYNNSQAEAVSGDNLNTFEQTCGNVAQLRSFIGTSGSQVFLRGFFNPNDGGQGEFYWNASGSGPDDDGITNIVPNGAAAGCWTRIVTTYVSGYINVKDYGATGNGITDDTISIQNALNAGTLIFFPPGNYKITSGLTAQENTNITAYGAVINASSSNFTALTTTGGGSIFGMEMIGPGNATYQDSSRAISCSGTNNYPAAPTFVNGPTIRDCYIHDWGGYGIRLQYCNRPDIQNCTIQHIGYAGCGGASINDGIFENNYVDDITPGIGLNQDAYGVFMDRNNGLSETSDPRSYRCSISFNRISGVTGWQGIDTHAGVDFRIIGNTITNCSWGIAVTGSVINGIALLAPQNCVVANNVVEITSTIQPAISITGAIVGSTVNEYATGNIVTGNSIRGGGTSGDGTSGAIFCEGTKNLIVSDNSILNSMVNGIAVYFENRSFVISGNMITDPWDNTVTVPACISFISNNADGLVEGNTFRFENASLGSNVAVQSVAFASGLSGLGVSIGENSYVGISSTHLNFRNLPQTGVNTTGAYGETGAGMITVTSGHANDSAVISFANQFPLAPKVDIQLNYPFNAGTKFPILGVDTGSPVSQTGFKVFALPYDASTWGSSGTLNFTWVATT